MPSTATPLLQVQGLCKTYTQGRWWQRKFQVHALRGVDLTLKPGSTLALVGESGSGKTTVAMCLAGLERPDAGVLLLNGNNLLESSRQPRTARREIQLVFQDSVDALNPRMPAGQIIEEPMLLQGIRSTERPELLSAVMEKVGLSSKWRTRLPHEFSGGQRQRLALARALVLRPKVLILDEAVAGLDLSVQGQVLNLLLDLQAHERLSYLYISHNLELVGQFADEIAVLHRGQIVEQASSSEIFSQPRHPCTQELLELPSASQGAHA
jgi:ABC-type glutathione transport system ATPase component